MTNEDLKAYRQRVELRQADMADLMGLSFRAYQEIETGNVALRQPHVLAVERVSLALAVERGDVLLALPSVKVDALKYALLH